MCAGADTFLGFVHLGADLDAVDPSTMPDGAVKNFGKQVPLKRAGQSAELATAYVMLADPLSSYTSGTTVAVSGANLSSEFRNLGGHAQSKGTKGGAKKKKKDFQNWNDPITYRTGISGVWFRNVDICRYYHHWNRNPGWRPPFVSLAFYRARRLSRNNPLVAPFFKRPHRPPIDCPCFEAGACVVEPSPKALVQRRTAACARSGGRGENGLPMKGTSIWSRYQF